MKFATSSTSSESEKEIIKLSSCPEGRTDTGICLRRQKTMPDLDSNELEEEEEQAGSEI